ncbi:MAG TPA: hypothetical protein VIS06_09610 [Mycobacteriales bacterium]
MSLPDELLAEARRAVTAGTAASVSAYVADAVRARMKRERALAKLETLFGGPPPQHAIDWARGDSRHAQAS